MVKQGPRPLVICGPSGSGKSTLLKKLFKELPETFGFRFEWLFSYAIFPPKCNLKSNRFCTAYHTQHANHVPARRMAFTITLLVLKRCKLLSNEVTSWNMQHSAVICMEQGENHDVRFRLKNKLKIFHLPISKQSVRNVQKLGKVCVLDIEIEGVKQIRNSDLNPILVFIHPPSLLELENRLRNRQTETEESLQKRLNTAKVEMEYGNASPSFILSLERWTTKFRVRLFR